MLDSEAATLAHQAIQEARKHLDMAMYALNSTHPYFKHLKSPIVDKIIAVANDCDNALSATRNLVTDQSAWGKYQSHPSGNNN